MFGKKDSDTYLNHSGRSYIGETMQIDGDIRASGSIDVAGLIYGNVEVKEMTVFDTGSVKGNLNVNK